MSEVARAPTPGRARTPLPLRTSRGSGLTAVLMGTFISTLNGRLSTFGLTDIRGAVHAGFDEGAWITTAQTVAQMLICPAAVWAGTVYGPRRVLLVASTAFGVISLLTPLSASLGMLLALQFASGLAVGFFIPLTLSFVLLNTPPKYWAFGIALYALNLELSLNISASLEGWYVDHLSWRWIFWQNAPLALIMALCLYRGNAAAASHFKSAAERLVRTSHRRLRTCIDLCRARSGKSFGLAELRLGLGIVRGRNSVAVGAPAARETHAASAHQSQSRVRGPIAPTPAVDCFFAPDDSRDGRT